VSTNVPALIVVDWIVVDWIVVDWIVVDWIVVDWIVVDWIAIARPGFEPSCHQSLIIKGFV
jgi:hypothetical protein